jgi:superfamily II DNA or RNA helicase
MARMPLALPQGEEKKTQSRTGKRAVKLSRLRKPEEMELEDWQRELRRQFGRDAKFELKNIGTHSVFSEFHVTNPESKNTYRVAIRGRHAGENYCSCPDFATNALGTCKHIESVLAFLAGQRGAADALRAGFQPDYSEVYLQYGARREVRFRPGRRCPVELARRASRYFDSEGALRPKAFGDFDRFLAEAGHLEPELRCYEDALIFIAEVRDGQRRRQLLEKAFLKGIRSPLFKKLLRVPLYDYQREGALFAAKAGRCLIGDEMGLGKTIQAIAAAEILVRLFGVERVLTICPTSLKHQWQREIEKFSGRPTQVIGGLRPRRQRQFAEPSFFKITNYDTIHRDLDLIRDWSPDLVILDEAQRIKNWSTRAARTVKKISSPYAIVLTGTPLENRLEELISIVQFVDQYRLGPTYRLLHDHQVKDDHGRVVGYKGLDRIGQSLAPVLIRRQKDQVLDQLPERLDKNFFVPMTPPQIELHEENRELVTRIVANWRRYHFLSEADQRRLMIALQNMRMVCDSTYLLDQETDFGVKADELATLLEEVFERPDAKVVIFSQWVRMHELLVRRFADRNWPHVLFHGGVPGNERGALIDRFRHEDRCRAFLSTDAGGVGLNLQHASVVINMDMPWNPAVLEQRIGRVHRLGQKQPVRVVNFVAQGTIEEGMLSVIRFKKSLFAGVLDGGEKEVFLGGSRLKRFMETVEKASAAIPEPAVEDRATAQEAAGEPSTVEAESEAQRTPGLSPNGGGEKGQARTVAAGPGSATSSQPLAGLLESGLQLLQQLAIASRSMSSSGVRWAESSKPRQEPTSLADSLIGRDEHTGQAFLKLPMPKPEVLEQALHAIGTFLEAWQQ